MNQVEVRATKFTAQINAGLGTNVGNLLERSDPISADLMSR